MSLFSRSKLILWPKSRTTEIFFSQKKESNNFSFEINLWKKCDDSDLQVLSVFLRQNHISQCLLLLPDDVVFSRSFIYDSLISHLDKKELATLAENFVPFKIDPDFIDFRLLPLENKTIIQSYIYDKNKITNLKTNLSKLHVKISSSKTVSSSISSVIHAFYREPYFLIYPGELSEHTLLLSKDNSVYLSSILKGQSLDIQKIINYSGLYFDQPVNKLFLPENLSTEIISTAQLDKTTYNASQIASKLNQAPNLPLPVVGLMIDGTPSRPAIMNITMENTTTSLPQSQNKKNILPLIAVFIFTAALASIIIWFVLNRNGGTSVSAPPPTPTTAIENQPSLTPTPSSIAINKKLKLQVLNATSINGQAATVKEKLVGLGFENVTVGNSQEKLTGNEIRFKPSLKDYQNYFSSSLGSDFPASYQPTLKETSTFDIVFLVGTDLRKSSPAPSTPPSPATTP